MNPYLSKDERESFVRLNTLAKIIEVIIRQYETVKSTDKTYLKFLRSAYTWLMKGLELRIEHLEESEKVRFYEQVLKLELIFVPSDKAKKEYADLRALKTTFAMSVEDFEDWYSFVIEATCKTCARTDYEECPARKVLSKYGVFPIDPSAKGRCQFSYGEALVNNHDSSDSVKLNQLWQQIDEMDAQLAEYDRLKTEINGILHPDGEGPESPSMCDLVAYIRADYRHFRNNDLDQTEQIRELTAVNNSMRQEIVSFKKALAESEVTIKKLQSENQELLSQYTNSLEPETFNEYPVTIGLASGGEFEYCLPEHMTKLLIAEIQRPKNYRSICAQYVTGQFVAVDLQDVVSLQVKDLPPGDWVKNRIAESSVRELPQETERFKIECKCGSEYAASMVAGRTKAKCRDCQSAVFADREAKSIVDNDGTPAILMTNRYFVSTEPRPEKLVSASIHKQGSSEYKDPCKIFG